MNNHQAQVRKSKMEKKALELRKQFWPDINDQLLWNRKERKGFTTIPRGMPLILRIMDDLSNGKPVSSTYLSLWCRVFDNNVVTITNPRDMAFEVGFSGQRAEGTWSARMKILSDLNFIDAKPGPYGPFSYVLIWNPYHVIKAHHKNNEIEVAKYNALFQRTQDIGANDLD